MCLFYISSAVSTHYPTFHLLKSKPLCSIQEASICDFPPDSVQEGSWTGEQRNIGSNDFFFLFGAGLFHFFYRLERN